MSTDDLHSPLYLPDLLANALNQTPTRPLIQLAGGPMLTVGEVRDATSQFVQALSSLGVGRGSRVATLSPNRPEVLHVFHSTQLLAAVGLPMHAMAALPDHLHVLRDAQAEVLVFDAARFTQRAQELAKEIPSLKLIALGESSIAPDLCKLAEQFKAGPLVAPKVEGSAIARLVYSGGTTGKPKSLATTQRSALAILQNMLVEWEWPTPPRVLSVTPLSHAGSAMILPTLLKQGTVIVQPGFDAVAVMQAIQEYRINSMLVVPTIIYALLDHPRFGGIRLVEPGDCVLWRVGHLAGAPERSHSAHRSGVLPVLWASRGTHDAHRAA